MNAGAWLFAVLALLLLGAFSVSLYWAGGRGKNGAPRGQSWALALAVPLAVVALYALRGTPQALDPPPAQAANPSGMAAGMPDPGAMVQRLADHLKDHPEDLDGWVMLARSYTALGRYPEAEAAYQRAQAKVMQDSDLLVNWIWLRVTLADRKFDARTQALVQRAATLAPDDPDVLLLRALAAFGRSDQAGGAALVRKLQDRYPPGSQDRQNLDAALEKWNTQSASAKPRTLDSSAPPAANAPAMPDLNAAVQRLAERLQQHPQDLDGWLMLARSYAVLGRYADADAAYQRAQTRIMQDGSLLAGWIKVRLNLSGGKFDARTRDLLDQAVKLAPDDANVLLLRALAAFGRGDQAGGAALVRKLQDRYPPGTPERQNLDAAFAKMMPPGAAVKP